MPHVGHADFVTNNEHGSRSNISDWSSLNPVTRVIKVTLPTPAISLYNHSYTYLKQSKHLICDCYITTLCVASRSGSRLIQYE